MTTIASTSAYSALSLQNVRKSDASTVAMATIAEDGSSSGGRRNSVYSSGVGSDELGSSSSASLALSSKLWDLLASSNSNEQSNEDSIDSQTFSYTEDEASIGTTTEEEFLNLSDMTLAERIRQQYLEENHLTEDDLKNMNADDRAKIEDEIREQIKIATKELTGVESGNLPQATA